MSIPPLAGLFGYEEASRPGFSVAGSAQRLWRLAYAHRRLHALAVDALPCTPEWEVKCALGLHCWLDAEHATALERRVNELRHPSVDVSKAPDPALALVFDELAHARDTWELLAGAYVVVRAAMTDGMAAYLATANPLADHPSVRLVEAAVRDAGRAVAWGRAAAAAVPATGDWPETVAALVDAAGGLLGDAPPGDPPDAAALRSAACPAEPDRVVRRDARFADPFNQSALIDEYCDDEERPADERAYALAYKRLREMDVPEWMAPIIADSGDQPFERRRELSRQLWDETRHAMMGQVALERQGVPFHAFPIDVQGSTALNTRFTPREAHLLLWVIEQDLMAAATGKKHELEVAALHGDPLLMTFQDFDWADEVLHARTGRRWIVAEFPSRDEAEAAARDVWRRYDEVAAELEQRSEQAEW
ncbi:MAG TPA: hypothetical protein VK631_21370, partial [Solirubrobacteraceae bacterium]|nr:hypothetical protein [Solirubrobacteraceae bacterium]